MNVDLFQKVYCFNNPLELIFGDSSMPLAKEGYTSGRIAFVIFIIALVAFIYLYWYLKLKPIEELGEYDVLKMAKAIQASADRARVENGKLIIESKYDPETDDWNFGVTIFLKREVHAKKVRVDFL